MLEELKKALEAAITDEQKKEVAEKFKDEISKISDDELDNIAGGKSPSKLTKEQIDKLVKGVIEAAKNWN